MEAEDVPTRILALAIIVPIFDTRSTAAICSRAQMETEYVTSSQTCETRMSVILDSH